MRLLKIDSLSLPGLEAYRTMRRPADHREKGIFVAEGEKVVRRLVQSRLKIVSILLTEEWSDKYSSLLEKREIEEGIYVAEKKLLEEIVGYRLHQGIMAIGRVPDPVDIFDMELPPGESRLLVAADGIANSENMGVIVRNCAAFGVDALIVGEISCDPYLRRAVRNSMGTVFELPIIYADNLANTLNDMRMRYGVKLVAAHPREASVPVSDANLSGDVCIVFGSEGEGISAPVVDACDITVRVPMLNEVDSMNVASSVGVILYESRRQRGKQEV